MEKVSKTVIFFGTDDFSSNTLNSLIKAGYNIVAVVTKPDSKQGRGQTITASVVKEIALKNNIEIWQPEDVTDINDKIMNLKDEPIGVLVSYGKLIPKSTIDLFKLGIINVHPSLLPKYRGPSPIEEAIKNGDSKTGITIMTLSAEMDAGAVYEQVYYSLSGDEDRLSLRESLAELGAKKIIELLPTIVNGSLKPVPQDESKASYCKLLQKDDANIDVANLSADKAHRLVRAYLGFPKTKINILDKKIIITKSHVSTTKNTVLDILCEDGKFLSIDELIGPSGRTISAKDFINGYRAS